MIINRTCTRNQLCLEILVEDHSQVTQLLQRGRNTSDRMWNKTFSESNVVLPWVLILSTSNPHKDSLFVSLQPIPIITVHGAIINCVFPPFCLVLKAAPRDSCDLSSPPSVSSKVMFVRSGNLLMNSLQAPCTLTYSVRKEAKPKLDMVLLLLGTIVCVLSFPEVLSFKHGDKFSQRLDRLCYSDRHCNQGEKVVELLCPLQRYMHNTMEQKELESTCATPQQLGNSMVELATLLSSTIAAAE